MHSCMSFDSLLLDVPYSAALKAGRREKMLFSVGLLSRRPLSQLGSLCVERWNLSEVRSNEQSVVSRYQFRPSPYNTLTSYHRNHPTIPGTKHAYHASIFAAVDCQVSTSPGMHGRWIQSPFLCRNTCWIYTKPVGFIR
jgi:hypothetical protein